MTRVKICGLTSERDVETVVDAGADALGFIVDVPVDTPRELTVDRAAELIASVPPFASTVLVTMPESAEQAVELAERVQPDTVQLHGDLSPAEAAAVTEQVPATTIKAVDADEPGRCAEYVDSVDALLVDSADGEGGGGTGETHDWERTAAVTADLDAPVILAGGLTPENVAAAVKTVAPYGVDVASGVEREPAEADGSRKDTDAVVRFVANANTTSEATIA
ncbi:phosphoribosylanthranilate isomerase [Natranaeroarchaeum sulfidigenes]|uniref:N-(5'-phosphoribosyl)anthranilate isomerase n=1 Tax=Natranaeroarchaeum sulfidigenes TaxID=2784880 RepID=A0A897MUE0_9EURY|nr:phosphoribosylanthranilate isomerase [Natranaeroarchaeum sulfidigenes]QSG04124.1 Phosphoribosylanthranilate isomerase [Natranaeroarchaeum sulfidigenes]